MSTISIHDKTGKTEGTVALEGLVRRDDSPRTFACSVRVLGQNWRQGTVGCKARGEVNLSTKKPWKQKGTGRARVGSARSPLWRGGGVTFGPQPRVRQLSINKKQKSLVLNNLLFSMLDANAISCLDFTVEQKPSTKSVQQLLNKAGFAGMKVAVFLPYNDELNAASFRNIPGVNVLVFDEPNAYHLGNADCWVFLKKDTDQFQEMVKRWH